MDTLYDILRKKQVAATPEEQVRQWFVMQLRDTAGVPVHQMMTEVSLSFGLKKYRADIVVYDHEQQPLAVVECKRPDVMIDSAVVEQAMRYNAVLGVSWLMLTNGGSTYIFRMEDGAFKPFGSFPDYSTMLSVR